MTNSHRKLSRYVPMTALVACCVGALIVARFYVAPDKFDWPAWVQAVGSIAAIVGAFLLARQQHVEERAIEKAIAAEDEVRRFLAIRALAVNAGALAEGMHAQLDDMYFTGLDRIARGSLNDFETAFRNLPLFEIPHEDLVVDCIGLPQAIHHLRSLLGQQDVYLADQRRSENAVGRGQMDNSFEQIVTIADDIRLLCTTEIQKRRAI